MSYLKHRGIKMLFNAYFKVDRVRLLQPKWLFVLRGQFKNANKIFRLPKHQEKDTIKSLRDTSPKYSANIPSNKIISITMQLFLVHEELTLLMVYVT